jgi:cell wall-associated NlpC family hydrolase
MTPAEVISAARSEIGTRFRHQGRAPGKGLDCAGLVVHVASLIGVTVRDERGYARQPSGARLESALDSQPSIFRVFGDPMGGDILVLRFDKDPQHLAIFTGDSIIHSTSQTGRVVEERFDSMWRLRLVMVYRFHGVNHE